MSSRAVSRIAALSLVALVFVGCSSPTYIALYPFRASVSYRLEDKQVIEERGKQVPIQRNDRVERLVELFEEAGCTDRALRLEPVSAAPTPNVICTLPGESPRRIIVGAHHVLAEGGKGIFDAWTSTALLPALYKALSAQPRHFTYEFIGFTSVPLRGDASYAYLQTRPERQERTAAMIWLDYLGLGPTSAWGSRSDPNLFVDFVSTADAVELDLVARDFAGGALIHDHSRAFRWYGIPTLYVHSLTISTERVIGDKKFDMNPETMDVDGYYDSYRLLTAYLGYLDKTLDARKL